MIIRLDSFYYFFIREFREFLKGLLNVLLKRFNKLSSNLNVVSCSQINWHLDNCTTLFKSTFS